MIAIIVGMVIVLGFLGYLAFYALGLPEDLKEYGKQSKDWTEEEFKSIIDNLEEDDI